jgi:F420-non-reducing hydrogenase iron-sulfur subunit
MSFEPKIIAFLCNWCSHRVTDTGGAPAFKFSNNIKPVRVMCSGRIEPDFILKALDSGADGVLVIGCPPGDCHYTDGNYKARRRIALLKMTLSQLGIEDKRIRSEWLSPSEGDRFLAITDEMTEQIKQLGPLTIRSE